MRVRESVVPLRLCVSVAGDYLGGGVQERANWLLCGVPFGGGEHALLCRSRAAAASSSIDAGAQPLAHTGSSSHRSILCSAALYTGSSNHRSICCSAGDARTALRARCASFCLSSAASRRARSM